jgi:phosphate acyltransferase
MVTIAIDIMGGDQGFLVNVPAVLLALRADKAISIQAFGSSEALAMLKKDLSASEQKRCALIETHEDVAMDTPPAHALRRLKKSSMRCAINAVSEGKADACLSAGNTGALMAISHYVLGMIPGIDRPAITGSFPTKLSGKSMLMLDLGANVDATADQLAQFALMGSCAAACMSNLSQPTVALLNVGHEMIKGNENVKAAHQILMTTKLNYKGFIEGNELLSGGIDVVVCDGFLGNIVLKSIEGFSKLIFSEIKSACKSGLLRMSLSPMVAWMLAPVAKKMRPSDYNGAALLGLKGIVIKSHGGCDVEGFLAAILRAKNAVGFQLTEKIIEAIQAQQDNTISEVPA